MDDLSFLVSRLNEEPFNLRLRLADFGLRKGYELLQILDVVLSSIDPKMNKVGVGGGDSRGGGKGFTNANYFDENWLESVVSLLTVLGYSLLSAPAQQERREWMEGLGRGDKDIVYPILKYCLTSHQRLCKRAYLGNFLLPVTLPAELSNDDDARILAQRYSALQDQFKDVHKYHSQLRKETESYECLEEDIAQMEREKQQLIHRIDILREQSRNEPSFDDILEVTSSMRKHQDEDTRLQTQLRNVADTFNNVTRNYAQVERRVLSLRKQFDGGSSVESILDGLNREVHNLGISVRSDMLLDWQIANQRLDELKRSNLKAAPTEDDLLLMQERVAELERQYSLKQRDLEAKRRAVTGDDGSSGTTVFEQYAAEAAADLREKKSLLETKSKDAVRLRSVVNDLEMMANEAHAAWMGQDAHEGENVRNKSKQYEAAMRTISKMQSETASLRRTEQSIKDRIANVDGHLRQQEESGGVGGYLDAKQLLEARNEAAVDLNAEKGHTLERISNVVSRIAKVIGEKKETLQPQIDLLKEKKAAFRTVEQEHKEKRERYERLTVRFAADRQAIEKESSCLQEEWVETEISYNELQASVELAEASLEKLRDFAIVSTEYSGKLAEQDSIVQQLEEEKMKILDNEADGSKQRLLFVNLERLLRLKKAMRENEKKKNGEVEQSDVL